MHRTSALLLAAAALSACATSPMADKKMSANPNATNIEVVAPTPVKAVDVMGNALMTTEAAMAEDAMKASAPVAAEAPAPTLENLYYTAQTKWEMMSFIEAVNAADLAASLEADGAMTIFAPTSDAFAQAGEVAATADLLKGHIVSGKLTAADLVARAAKGENSLPTLAGTNLTLYVMGDSVKVADASGRLFTVTQADSEASNGVLHMINGVLSGK